MQRRPAVVIAGGLGSGRGVQHGKVGVEHRHDPPLTLPVKTQEHTALIGGVDRAFGIGVHAHKIDRAAQLPLPGAEHTGGEPAAVGGEIQCDRRTGGLGHLPAVQQMQRRVKHLHLRGVAARLRDNGKGIVVGHGTEQDARVKALGIECPGAAADRQLGPGAVVHGKMGAAHGQHRPCVGRLQTENLGTVGRIDNHILGPQFDKAARKRLDLQRLADACGSGPAAVCAVDIEHRAVHSVPQHSEGGRQGACQHGDGNGQHRNEHAEKDPPPVLALLVERRQGFKPRAALPCCGVGGFWRRRGAAHRLGGAQADVPAGAADACLGGLPLLPRQHPLPPRQAFFFRFVHG